MNIDAELELKSSSRSGCVFRLSLPQKLTLPVFVSADQFPE
jgi:hypothetical protein